MRVEARWTTAVSGLGRIFSEARDGAIRSQYSRMKHRRKGPRRRRRRINNGNVLERRIRASLIGTAIDQARRDEMIVATNSCALTIMATTTSSTADPLLPLLLFPGAISVFPHRRKRVLPWRIRMRASRRGALLALQDSSEAFPEILHSAVALPWTRAEGLGEQWRLGERVGVGVVR